MARRLYVYWNMLVSFECAQGPQKCFTIKFVVGDMRHELSLIPNFILNIEPEYIGNHVATHTEK